MKKTNHIILFIVITFIQTAIAQPEMMPMVSDSIFSDTETMNAWLSENKIATLGIGYINEGQLSEIRVLGNLKENHPAPHNAIFNVASLTKPVVAMLALELVSQGKWNLDEPLAKYWIDPDIADDPRHQQLTTRHVLSHQTGFTNWRWHNESLKLEFAFDPGTQYTYSGEGFEYLKKALENKFEQPLDQLADTLLFQPLGMKDTRLYWTKEMDDSNFAVPHTDQGTLHDMPKNTSVSAADNLITTVADYGTFLTYVLKRIESGDTIIQEMIKPQVELKKNKAFGLGWELYQNLGDGEYAISHGGSDKGVEALVFLLPQSKKGLIIFTNSDDAPRKIYPKLIFYYLKSRGQDIFNIEMGE